MYSCSDIIINGMKSIEKTKLKTVWACVLMAEPVLTEIANVEKAFLERFAKLMTMLPRTGAGISYYY